MPYLRKVKLRRNMNDNVTITRADEDAWAICISCWAGSGSYRGHDYTSSYFYNVVIAFHHEKTDTQSGSIYYADNKVYDYINTVRHK